MYVQLYNVSTKWDLNNQKEGVNLIVAWAMEDCARPTKILIYVAAYCIMYQNLNDWYLCRIRYYLFIYCFHLVFYYYLRNEMPVWHNRDHSTTISNALARSDEDFEKSRRLKEIFIGSSMSILSFGRNKSSDLVSLRLSVILCLKFFVSYWKYCFQWGV